MKIYSEKIKQLTVLNAGQNYHIVGGSDRGQLALEKILEQHGHQIIPFATTHNLNYQTKWSKYFPPRVNFEKPGIKDIINFIYSLPATKAIQELLKSTTIDIAHLHIYYGQLTSSILAPLKKAGIPIVQTLHEYKIICPVYTLISNDNICEECQGHNFWKATFKRCNRGSLMRSILSTVESYVSKAFGAVDSIDHFITLSHFQRQKVIDLGLPPDKVTAIHNFIDTSNIEPHTQIGEYFLYFGRLEKIKGLLTLVEASSSIKDVPLLIVGKGNLDQELKTLIEQRGLNHIKLLPFCDQDSLKELIRNCICSILPSQWYETLGMTLLESFSHGRPVIASNMGGITEVVTHGRDGYLVSPSDVEELRESMIKMAQNRQKAVEMGLEGRKKVESHFHPQKYYAEIIKVYQKVL